MVQRSQQWKSATACNFMIPPFVATWRRSSEKILIFASSSSSSTGSFASEKYISEVLLNVDNGRQRRTRQQPRKCVVMRLMQCPLSSPEDGWYHILPPVFLSLLQRELDIIFCTHSSSLVSLTSEDRQSFVQYRPLIFLSLFDDSWQVL